MSNGGRDVFYNARLDQVSRYPWDGGKPARLFTLPELAARDEEKWKEVVDMAHAQGKLEGRRKALDEVNRALVNRKSQLVILMFDDRELAAVQGCINVCEALAEKG